MFHRVEDWRRLPSSRYFSLAERLVHYQGAVRALLVAEQEPQAATRPTGGLRGPSVAAGTAEDIAALAAMSQNPGFPGIGYSGG